MAENNEVTVVGTDSHFKGELNFERTAKITGKFDGKISGSGELLVGNDALCKADVNTGSVSVDGTVEGNVQAKEVVRLNSKGVVRGDIVAGKMVMAEGASFYGQCAVGTNSTGQRSGVSSGSISERPTVPPPMAAQPVKK